MATTRKLQYKAVKGTASSHVGSPGDIFYDPGVAELRMYDGNAGGMIIGGGGGGTTSTVIALTGSTQNFYLPNPDEVEVPVGTIYEFSVTPFYGALDTQRDINFSLQNTVTYSPYFAGTVVINKSDTGDQIQSITPITYFQWPMFTGTPGTNGIICGQAKIVYCGTGTFNIPGSTTTGHFYTVIAHTDMAVFGGG